MVEIRKFTSGNAPMLAKGVLMSAHAIGATNLETAIAAATVLGSLVVEGVADRDATLSLVELTIDAMVAGQVKPEIKP
jgi:hypothetical protein